MIRSIACCLAWVVIGLANTTWAQSSGGIRGNIVDSDFDVPLANVTVRIAETNTQVTGTAEGSYVFPQTAPGQYTLVFTKEGYNRVVKPNVLVGPGRLTEVNVSLSGEFTELEEFVVQDLELSTTDAESSLLQLRIEAPALIDSISSDLISQAGAGDAAAALSLVSGATVEDGKFAVVRGLPDRYVNSQINGIRLPTADAEKRAVELDQFPSSAIESLQVTKTFTPDQQGDASGGAVNIVLKGLPEESVFNLSFSSSVDSDTPDGNNFQTYEGGGVNTFARDKSRRIQTENLGKNWEGAVGVSDGPAPENYKWTATVGGRHEFDDDLKIGGLASLFYERDSSFVEGIDDRYVQEEPGAPLTPQGSQGSPGDTQFLTSLFDVKRASQEVKWGFLGVLGLETENHKVTLTHLYTRSGEDTALRAENTRGKEYYFPGYNPNDPLDPGNQLRQASPYLRSDALTYVERFTQTTQLRGVHKMFDPDLALDGVLRFLPPELTWSASYSLASSREPDKRQFGSAWYGPTFLRGIPPFFPDTTLPAQYVPYKPAANFTIGNFQRTFRDIEEESRQFAVDLKFPFEQWSNTEGYIKFGMFNDEVVRTFDQESFANFNDNSSAISEFDVPWSDFYLRANHPISEFDIDVDYRGNQKINASYYMFDVPLFSFFKIIGGARYESTDLEIINFPEANVTWFPPGASAPVVLNPGDADVRFQQDDILPSLGFVYTPFKSVSIRGTYAQTIARQTFRELTPIQQQEYLGGDIFIGNPFLRTSRVKNYDIRVDYNPAEGSLVSLSYFYKDIQDPIEFVQRVVNFDFISPVNYPSGTLLGYEFELRQSMGNLFPVFEGLQIGGNTTFIESEVLIPEDEQAQLNSPGIQAPSTSRNASNAPEHLYNFFFNYDLDKWGLGGSKVGLFYTVRGDTLVAGSTASSGYFVPDIYERQFGTLNMSFGQKVGDWLDIKLQAKNLLDPDIQTVYRSKYIGPDVVKSSYRKGKEYSFGVGFKF